MCATWYVRHMVCAPHGVCATWCVRHMVCAPHGVCAAWCVCHMVPVPHGVCATWCLCLMVCAPHDRVCATLHPTAPGRVHGGGRSPTREQSEMQFSLFFLFMRCQLVEVEVGYMYLQCVKAFAPFTIFTQMTRRQNFDARPGMDWSIF